MCFVKVSHCHTYRHTHTSYHIASGHITSARSLHASAVPSSGSEARRRAQTSDLDRTRAVPSTSWAWASASTTCRRRACASRAARWGADGHQHESTTSLKQSARLRVRATARWSGGEKWLCKRYGNQPHKPARGASASRAPEGLLVARARRTTTKHSAATTCGPARDECGDRGECVEEMMRLRTYVRASATHRYLLMRGNEKDIGGDAAPAGRSPQCVASAHSSNCAIRATVSTEGARPRARLHGGARARPPHAAPWGPTCASSASPPRSTSASALCTSGMHHALPTSLCHVALRQSVAFELFVHSLTLFVRAVRSASAAPMLMLGYFLCRTVRSEVALGVGVTLYLGVHMWTKRQDARRYRGGYPAEVTSPLLLMSGMTLAGIALTSFFHPKGR